MGLKLLKITPLKEGSFKDLSYFTLKDVRRGDLVSIPLRKKEIKGAVLSVSEVAKTKSSLKQSSFSIKKISALVAPNFFENRIINAAEKTARFFLTNPGGILKEICPVAIIEQPPKAKQNNQKTPQKEKNKILIALAPQKERAKYYKNLVRTEFAKKKSVFLCVPDIGSLEYYWNSLKTGIEKYTYQLHGGLAKTTIKNNWAKIAEENHPVLIIATGLFLTLPLKNLNTIIIENEGSPLYKTRKRPFFDIRMLIENIANERNMNVVLADEITRVETYKREKEGKLGLTTPVSDKIISRSEQIFVDMGKEKGPISKRLEEVLMSVYKHNERTILFINRRGHGLSTACGDCGKIIHCPRCDSPLVLHKKIKNIFICHKCLLVSEPIEKCPYCKSWKLQTLGYGIQKIAEEIKKQMPEAKIFRIDSDAVKTKKQGREIMKNYMESGGGILIATEMIFSFLKESVERIAVISVDGLFSLPDFRINERIFRLLLKLKMRTKKTFLLQTRMPENALFKYILDGDVKGFCEKELELRKKFGYTPFKTLIKISCEHEDKISAEKETRNLCIKLKEYNPINYVSFVAKIKNLYHFHALLKLDPETWPDKQKKLHEILSALPLQWKIDVNPESLL